jgi:hypothetical protein
MFICSAENHLERDCVEMVKQAETVLAGHFDVKEYNVRIMFFIAATPSATDEVVSRTCSRLPWSHYQLPEGLPVIPLIIDDYA